MPEGNTYTIKLEHFEGPFDLLLYFIQRDELDIYDIPIASITNDFLVYINQLEKLNIEVAAEFILMAATLMRIKARMLIARRDLDESGEEIDPRADLIERLLEYKRYKEVIVDLRVLEETQAKRFDRSNISEDLQVVANKALMDLELESLTLYNLMRAFQRMLESQKERKRTVHTIVRYNYTIRNQQKFILSSVKLDKPALFEDVFKDMENRVHAIVTFLALLELANRQVLHIQQRMGSNNFVVQAGQKFKQAEDYLEEEE